MTGVPAAWRRRLLAVVVAVVLVLPVLGVLHVRLLGPSPRDLVLGVVAPGVVAQETARRAGSLPENPFDARAIPTLTGLTERADRDVRTGRLEAALVVDFRRAADQLVVPATMSPTLVRDLRARLRPVSGSLARDLDVRTVAPQRSTTASAGVPFVLVTGWVLLGLLGAATLSAWRGPVAPTAGRGAARLGVLAVFAGLVGLVTVLVLPAEVDASSVRIAAAAAGTVAVSAWLVLALEALLGLAGIAVAVGLLAGPLAPFLVQIRPEVMPLPWPFLYEAGVPGAALDLATQIVFGGSGETRARLILASWGTVAIVALASARGQRPTTERPPGGGLSGAGTAPLSPPRTPASPRPRSR